MHRDEETSFRSSPHIYLNDPLGHGWIVLSWALVGRKTSNRTYSLIIWHSGGSFSVWWTNSICSCTTGEYSNRSHSLIVIMILSNNPINSNSSKGGFNDLNLVEHTHTLAVSNIDESRELSSSLPHFRNVNSMQFIEVLSALDNSWVTPHLKWWRLELQPANSTGTRSHVAFCIA